MMLTHGFKVRDRIHGFTRKDREPAEERYTQILEYVEEHQPERFAAIDDLFMPFEWAFRTEGDTGITEAHRWLLVAGFTGGAPTFMNPKEGAAWAKNGALSPMEENR